MKTLKLLTDNEKVQNFSVCYEKPGGIRKDNRVAI
jgi:hypothetical protein